MPEDLLEQEPETAETKTAEGDDTQEDGDYTGPKGQGDLPLPLVNALKGICQKMDQRELQPRINQVAKTQKARLFWRSQQYLKRSEQEGTGTNGTIYTPIDPDAMDDQDKMYVFNIYKGYGKSFVATFAQAPCGTRFEPNDLNIPSDVSAATEAESARKMICKINNQKELQRTIAKVAWNDGLVVFFSRSVTSPKYGFDKDGKPRSYPEIEVGGALEWKVPIAQGDFDDWDYVRNQKDISLTKAKSDYPKKENQLQAGSSKDIDYSRQARMSVAEGMGLQTQTGDAVAIAATRTRYWLRPSALNDLDDPTIKSELLDYFPKGTYVCFIGENYVESRDESMDDHVVVFKAVDDDGYNCNGLGHEELGPQETFNDLANLARVTFVRGVPHSFFDEKLIPPEARKNQKSTPGCAHPVALPAGEDIRAKFTQEEPANTPATMTQYMDNVQGKLSQFLTGQQPALYGGEMGEAGETAAGYQQALSQAMGLMGLVWVPFKRAWAQVMRQCVAIMAESNPPGTVLSTVMSQNNGDQETVSVTVDNLKGQYLAYPDTDENFPESWSAKKATYMTLRAGAKDDPALMAILNHPDNQRMGKDLGALPDLTIPGEDSADKQMQEIEEMEKQPPVPDPNSQQYKALQAAQASGAFSEEQLIAAQRGLPLTSSVSIGKYDDNPTELAKCVSWINSPTGQKAKREKPEWYQNVELHADLHHAAIQAAQQGPEGKPPSESINFKDLPPGGQSQMAKQAGIDLSPEEIEAKQVADKQLAAAQKTLTGAK